MPPSINLSPKPRTYLEDGKNWSTHTQECKFAHTHTDTCTHTQTHAQTHRHVHTHIHNHAHLVIKKFKHSNNNGKEKT